MKRIVIDASVALKWYLSDEEDGPQAIHLLTHYVSNELDILAPSLLEYEVINGLLIAQRKGRVKEEKVNTAMDGFMHLEIKLIGLSLIYTKLLRYCRMYNRSVYDASYLAVADENEIPLITADEGLYNAVKKDLKWVKWLGDI